MNPPAAPSRVLGLRTQILVALGAVALVALLSTGGLALWAAGDTLREQREINATWLAAATGAAVSSALEPGGALDDAQVGARLGRVLREVGEASQAVSLAVLSLQRRTVAAWPRHGDDEADPPVAMAALSGVPSVLNYRRSAGGGMQLLAYAPVGVKGQVVAAVRVVLAAPAPIPAFFFRSGPLLFALALADAVLLLALGYLVLTRLVIRPLRAMERATERVSTGDLDQRIAASGPREVAALAAAFNQMTSSLSTQREQLIRTEKLASVGQLAAGVAHEIGNPLAAILGYADVLRLDLQSPTARTLTDAERSEILGRVKAETQRIHRIIQDLLEYSRPGREDAQPTDVRAVLAEAQTLLAPQARFRDVRLEVAPGPGEDGAWPLVLAAPGRLKQVLVNLLLNAADAMDGSGTIHASCSRGGGRLQVTIADEGPGVAEGLRRKIFDPFFTTKAPGKGTGLGLSISRAIVETDGGTLELATQPLPGVGAQFVVTWRLSSTEEASFSPGNARLR